MFIDRTYSSCQLSGSFSKRQNYLGLTHLKLLEYNHEESIRIFRRARLKERLSESIQYYKKLRRHRDDVAMRKQAQKLGAAVPAISTYNDMMKIFTPYPAKEFNYLLSLAERYLPEDVRTLKLKLRNLFWRLNSPFVV